MPVTDQPSGDTSGPLKPYFARCVALAQARRGHGQSTFTWYLARALVTAGLRVLVVDMTGRHSRLNALSRATTVKNLGVWKPAVSRPPQVAALIQAARQQTRGRVDVLLVDCDAALLESAGGLAAGVDYVLALVDPTQTGHTSADRLAELLGDAPPPSGRVGVVFCRASADQAEHFPQQTIERHLPILGYFPADYLLAGEDADQQRGGRPIIPHDDYLQAVQRLSRMLIRLAELRRIPPGGQPSAPPVAS